jgi:hypothetical protein
MKLRTLYAAKCYWPAARQAEVAEATRRAVISERSIGARRAVCLGAIFFPLDHLVLCMFEATSAGDVRQASEQAGLPCERVMQAVWLSGQSDQQLLVNEAQTTRDVTNAPHREQPRPHRRTESEER